MIKESRIKENLKKFAFPRLSGTEFELKAFNILKKEVENLNIEYETQPFTFSSFYSRIYPKIAFISFTLILLLLYFDILITISIILIFILLILLVTSIILTRNPEKIQFFFRLSSQNLLVKIKSISNDIRNKDRIALFISHLDSKSQRFGVRKRIRIIKFWISSSIILGSIIVLKDLIFIEFQILFYIIGLVPLIINILSSILTLFNTTDNKSNGAIDNASGIACNLEMVNYYNIPENRLQNYNMWFLFTGAEECGTMGIRFFYNNLENFNPNKSIIYDFESIANYVFLWPGKNEGEHAKSIDLLLLNNKRKLQIRHYPTERVLGTHSDGGFLGDRGFQGFGIGGVESYAYIHTPYDTIDKIDTKILTNLCLVLTDALKQHDSTLL
ncbi:MAG: M28 family peptidase [Promethearchaeota archaeon]